MIEIRDLKENEWVKCENEEEIRVLWDWFNRNGYVKVKDDGLEEMIGKFKNFNNNIFRFVKPEESPIDYGWYDGRYDDTCAAQDTYTNFKDLIIHKSDSTDPSILKVNVKVKPEVTNLSIKDLKDGQTFIMSDVSDGHAEYLAIKTSDADGEVYVTTFDDFKTYKNNEKYYTVVRLVNCELNEV